MQVVRRQCRRALGPGRKDPRCCPPRPKVPLAQMLPVGLLGEDLMRGRVKVFQAFSARCFQKPSQHVMIAQGHPPLMMLLQTLFAENTAKRNAADGGSRLAKA